METALKEAGTCGRFQVCHVIFTQLPRFVSVWGIMIMMFGSYNPGWRCKDILEPSGTSFRNSSSYEGVGGGTDDIVLGLGNSDHRRENDNSSYSLFRNIPPEKRDDKMSLGGDLIHGVKSQSTDAAGFDNLSLTMVTKGNGYIETCDVMEWCGDVEFNTASNTVVSEFKLVCDRKWILRVMLLVMSVGFLLGALVGGQVGEKFGRKVSLYGGCFIMFVFSLLAIFSTHWVMYMVCLFLIGFGAHFTQSTSAIFSMEFLTSKWRSLVGSIPTWNIAMCALTLTTALMRDWTHLHIVISLLSLLACVGFLILPESVRWLAVHGDSGGAIKVVQKVARINKRPIPNDDTCLKLKNEIDSAEYPVEIILQNEEEKSLKLQNASPEVVAQSQSQSSTTTTYSFIHLFRDRQMCILTIKFTIVFLVSYMTYYALSYGVNSLPGDFYVNAVASSFCEISLVILTGPLCNKIGRRWAGFIMSATGTSTCCGIIIALYAASGGEVQSTAIKACAFIARSGSMAIYHVGTIFMSELFPTAVRNVAFGFLTAMSGVGALVGPFLVPEPGRDSFAVCFSVMAFGYVVVCVLFLSLSETNRLCLVDRIDDTAKARINEDESV